MLSTTARPFRFSAHSAAASATCSSNNMSHSTPADASTSASILHTPPTLACKIRSYGGRSAMAIRICTTSNCDSSSQAASSDIKTFKAGIRQMYLQRRRRRAEDLDQRPALHPAWRQLGIQRIDAALPRSRVRRRRALSPRNELQHDSQLGGPDRRRGLSTKPATAMASWCGRISGSPIPGTVPTRTTTSCSCSNVRDIVLRIRNHASIGLYCGRNEGFLRPAARRWHPQDPRGTPSGHALHPQFCGRRSRAATALYRPCR